MASEGERRGKKEKRQAEKTSDFLVTSPNLQNIFSLHYHTAQVQLSLFPVKFHFGFSNVQGVNITFERISSVRGHSIQIDRS